MARAGKPASPPYQLTQTRMHFRLLVTTGNARSSLQAREQVYAGLLAQGFLINPDLRWSGGIADWFLIGGRFSGDLAGISDAAWQSRDRGARLGAEDDAMLVTDALYDRFLAPNEEWSDEQSCIDLEYERLSRAFIGRKWLVVVDYHR